MMGDYTRVEFVVKLKEDTPGEVITLLQNMDTPPANREWYKDMKLPMHELFVCWRWPFMLNHLGDLPDGTKLSNFVFSESRWVLHAKFSLKNYEDEIEKLLSWLFPWIDAPVGAVIGSYKFCDYTRPVAITMRESSVEVAYQTWNERKEDYEDSQAQ